MTTAIAEWIEGRKTSFGVGKKAHDEQEGNKWLEQGTLSMWDYLAEGAEAKGLLDNSHRRIFRRLFAEPGIVRMNWDTMPQRCKALGLSQNDELYLPRLFLDDFYDMELTLHYMTLFMLNAARGGEAARQMLGLFGFQGTAKTSILDFMKAKYTDTVFFHIDGCPMHESALRLIPKWYREELSGDLGVLIPPDEDICDVCRYTLINEHGGDWTQMMVRANTISSRQNRGIAVVPPFDQNTQGSEVLIGDIRIESLQMTGKDKVSPAELYRYSGAFNHGQGGIIDLREAFKTPKELRNLTIIASQDGEFPSPKYEEWFSSDFRIILTANMPETVRWMMDDENDAFFDRIYPIPVPALTSYLGEMKVHHKMLSRLYGAAGFAWRNAGKPQEKKLVYVPNPQGLIDEAPRPHIAIGSDEVAAKFAVGSRLDPKDERGWNAWDLSPVITLLSGEGDVEQIREHRRKHLTEGFSGLSPRFVEKALEDADAGALLRWDPDWLFGDDATRRSACWNVDDVLRSIYLLLEHQLIFSRLGEAKQDEEKITSLLGMLEGSFKAIPARQTKQVLADDIHASGIIRDVTEAGKFEQDVERGVAHFVEQVRAHLAASAIPTDSAEEVPEEDSPDIDAEFLAHILGRMRIPAGGEQAFMEQLIEELDRHPEVEQKEVNMLATEVEALEGFDDPDAFLDDVRRAVLRDHLATRRDEVLLQVAEYIRDNISSEEEFQEKILSKLPEGKYCISCFMRALQASLSPMLVLDERVYEEPPEAPEEVSSAQGSFGC